MSKNVMTTKSWSLPSKTHHDVKGFVMAQKHVMTSKVRQDVKKFVMKSKRKFVIAWKGVSWRQKYVITSKGHGVINYAVTYKFCYDVKNCVMDVTNFKSYLKCQIRFLFAFVLRIFWDHLTFMCRSRVMNNYNVLHNCGDLDLVLGPMPVIFLDNAGIIPATQCDIWLWIHIHTRTHTWE